ncbi:MAG: zf-HC2 domain-containing protein [Rhodothermus sp.]|nr:zf-HC2 domain-containing protein [Rhodothermus sp.]
MKAWLQRWLGRRRLTCEDVNRFLAAYLDGALDAHTRAAFEAHLQDCDDCQAYLDQYRKTIELVRQAADVPEPPPALIEHTLSFLRERLFEEPPSNA